jgi:hypothetical protein
MEQASDKEFFQLLDTVVKQQSITAPNTDGNIYSFQTLTANQLKELVQTLVDKSLTNLSFNSALYKIIEQNLIKEPETKPAEKFNLIDVTLFLLSARSQIISEKIYMVGEEDKALEINLQDLIKKLLDYIRTTTPENIESNVIETENIKAVIGIPFMRTETLTNNQIYKNLNLSEETKNSEVETFVGNAFIAEITKWIKTLQIEEKVLDYDNLPFNSKVKILESLPATLVEKILDYIEKTKRDMQLCITVSGKVLPLNGSLFSVR